MIRIGQGLLTLLISLFIFSGCKNALEVGLDVDAARQVDLQIVDTATIRTTTVREDTTAVSALSQHPFGFLDDAEIGTTRSDIALAFTLGTSGIIWGNQSTIDSAVLILKYGNEFYGDSVSSTYRADIHELGEAYNRGAVYYNTKTWTFGATPVGGRTLTKFIINKNVKVTEPVVGKADSVKNYGPQLRIRIDTTFIRTRFVRAPDSTFADVTKFAAWFKGFYLRLNRNSSTGRGGLVTFNLSAVDSSMIKIYYRNKTGAVIDTLTAFFPVNTTNAAASIAHTYTPAVQTQLGNPTQQFSTTFVQPLAGLRTRLTFPYIDRLKSLGNILVNKAELVVMAEPSSLDPAARLTVYRTDIAAQRLPVPDNDIGQRNGTPDPRALSERDFGGFYDTAKKRYVFNITSYVQDLVNGRLTQYQTFIGPANSRVSRASLNDVLPLANTVGRSIIGGGNGTLYKMKLNIIYTKVNQ